MYLIKYPFFNFGGSLAKPAFEDMDEYLHSIFKKIISVKEGLICFAHCSSRPYCSHMESL